VNDKLQFKLDPDKQYVEFVRDERDYDREAFDRVKYAAKLLKILAVPARVAICSGGETIRIQQGTEPGAPRKGRWAIVSIPPDASRAHIAVALAKMAGRQDEPYVLDVLLRARVQ
jgi:hypothetical protein